MQHVHVYVLWCQTSDHVATWRVRVPIPSTSVSSAQYQRLALSIRGDARVQQPLGPQAEVAMAVDGKEQQRRVVLGHAHAATARTTRHTGKQTRSIGYSDGQPHPHAAAPSDIGDRKWGIGHGAWGMGHGAWDMHAAAPSRVRTSRHAATLVPARVALRQHMYMSRRCVAVCVARTNCAPRRR
jgi:hypothetical protein